MKKFLLSILCCLLAVVNVQAEETVTFNFKDLYGSGTVDAISKTVGGIEISYAQNGASNVPAFNKDGTLRFYYGSGGNGCSATFTTDGTKKITKAKITASSTNYTPTVKYSVDGSSLVEGSWDSNEMTISGIEASNTLMIQNANTSNTQLRIKTIVLTVETVSGGDPGVPETPETPVAPDAPTLTASCSFVNSMDVEITNIPEGVTVYYTTDESTPSAVNGVVYKAPFEITARTTVKAVAIKDELTSEVVSATYTAIDPDAKNYTIVASEQRYENGEAVASLIFGDVTATFDKGSNSNAPKYYTTGSAIRAYGGNTITFAGAGGVTITDIEFTFASGEGTNAITASPGTFSTNKWSGASNEVVFTIGGTSGHRRIATIEVTYSVDENVVVIATPSITSSTSFVGSTTVEITNNAEGTTLYYSTNGEDYAQYTGALTITETKTVSAYSQDAEGNKSSVAEATFTKIEVLTIAEAKAAYDDAGSNVTVAVDLTGAVVTVNSGQYLFIENETTGINLYNSGAYYAVGTKFTAGYILGTSTAYSNMHQITSAEFHNVKTTTVTVEPTEVAIDDIKGNYAEYEGRFVKLSGVSVNVAGTTITQGEDTYALYNRFALTLPDVAKCDVEGIVAIYNTKEQLYITKVTPIHPLQVTSAGYATLFLDFAAAIPADVKVYAVTEVNNGYVSMTEIEDVLPANTGVIIEASEGDYDFVASEEDAPAVADNKLLGTTKDTNIAVEAYVLSMVDGEVGLYKAEMNAGAFLNNANKAYLPAYALPASVQGANGFKFRFETTGVEGVQVAQGKKVIFDLSGRKVNDMTAPGVYIVNGKKVLVK